jgi:hypothetical protein
VTQLSSEIAILVQEVTGETGIGPQTRLDGDLLLDSLELAALNHLMRGKYGENVDLLGFVTNLELDQLIDLTVADVAAFVEGTT